MSGPDGERSLPVEDLFSGYYETVLAKNELIASVQVPAQRGKRAAYMKVTTGSVDDWPALGIAVVIEGDADAVKSARIVASAATEKATRLKAAEAILNGNRIDDTLLRRAADAAVDEAEFVADVRGSVPYKRELMRVYVQRAVQRGLGRERGALMATIEKPHTTSQGRFADRPLGAPHRGTRQGHRPRRICPHHAAAGDAGGEAVPQHGGRTAASSRSTPARRRRFRASFTSSRSTT